MTRIVKRYVVLYGDNGVSKEFRSPKTALRHGEKLKEKYPKKEVTLDELNITGRGDQFSQHTIKVIKVKKSPSKKKVVRKVVRRKTRNNDIFGFGNLRTNPFMR